MTETKIEWTDQTDNPIRARNIKTGGVGHYCEKISPGCAHCYAEKWQPRFGNPIQFNRADRQKVNLFLDEKLLRRVHRYRQPRKIFVCDMTDLFGDWVREEWLDKIMAAYAALDRRFAVQLVTKRAERMRAYFSEGNRLDKIAAAARGLGWQIRTDHWPLPHFWLIVSPVNQKTAEELIPPLLQTPAAIRGVSYEPALGSVDFEKYLPPIICDACWGVGAAHHVCRGFKNYLDWGVCGFESGPHARPGHPDWARTMRDQFVAAGAPFFFKQRGEWSWDGSGPARAIICNRGSFNDYGKKPTRKDWDVISAQHQGHGYCHPYAIGRPGKKRAGRLLDGREWNEFPAPPIQNPKSEIQNSEVAR